MRLTDIEQRIAAMDGGQLLEELVMRAMEHWENDLRSDDRGLDAVARALQVRLAETGIARKHHLLGQSPPCPFPLNHCRCPAGAWSWPRKGLPL